jgi:hypothetical protein
MKKTLLICIGLTSVVSIILVKLYSASVVSFIADLPEEDSILTNTTPVEIAKIQSAEEEEAEEEVLFVVDEEEYMDTLIQNEDTIIVKVNPTYIDCIVLGDQKITRNIPVKFKITENLEVKEKFIPQNTIVYAMPDIGEKGIDLRISSLKTIKGFTIISLHALKQDLEDVLSANQSEMLYDGDTILFDY